MNIFIYTDGACSGNHDKKVTSDTGYGVVLICKDSAGIVRKERHISGYTKGGTNNTAELEAAIQGLLAVNEGTICTLYSDSKYVVQGITEWMDGWIKKGWKGSNRKPVANKELWVRLNALNVKRDVTWEWLKGHAGHPEQELADTLAVNASLFGKGIDDIKGGS